MHAADLLEDAGYKVVAVASADEAFKILEARDDVRVLFTDVHLPPGLSGIELAAEVHRRWPDVLLLVTSAGASLKDEDVPDHGKFVGKPYDGNMPAEVDGLIAGQQAAKSREG